MGEVREAADRGLDPRLESLNLLREASATIAEPAGLFAFVPGRSGEAVAMPVELVALPTLAGEVTDVVDQGVEVAVEPAPSLGERRLEVFGVPGELLEVKRDETPCWKIEGRAKARPP